MVFSEWSQHHLLRAGLESARREDHAGGREGRVSFRGIVGGSARSRVIASARASGGGSDPSASGGGEGKRH